MTSHGKIQETPLIISLFHQTADQKVTSVDPSGDIAARPEGHLGLSDEDLHQQAVGTDIEKNLEIFLEGAGGADIVAAEEEAHEEDLGEDELNLLRTVPR